MPAIRRAQQSEVCGDERQRRKNTIATPGGIHSRRVLLCAVPQHGVPAPVFDDKAQRSGFVIKQGGYAFSITPSLRSLNKREMHQIAPSPIRVYTTLLSGIVCPPNRYATKSNLNIPIDPQLSPPRIARTSEILSKTIIKNAS